MDKFMDKLRKLVIGVAGFLVGGLIAAAVALLYAPQSGKQTRSEINENVLLAKKKASMAIEDAKGRVINTAEEVQGRAQHILETVGQGAQHKANQLKEIGSIVVNEQKTSLERGADEAMEVLKS